MTLNESYVHVQQRLQNIAAFVYKNVTTPELDYFWYSGVNKFIKLAFPTIDDERPNEKFSEIQASLDDLRVLIVSDTAITVTETTVAGYTYVSGSLPANYKHLLSDTSIVQPVDCTTDGTMRSSNRLTKADILFNVLENSIYKSTVESPVSRIVNNTLVVYTSFRGIKTFNVSAVYIEYLKKPTKYVWATDAATILEFPDDVCFKIIDTTVLYMAIIAEQNQSKIQLLQRQ